MSPSRTDTVDSGGQAPIPKITLKLLGGSSVKITGQTESNSSSKSQHSSSSSSSNKRKHSSSSSAKLEGPAAKMARAIGTDLSREERFLESTDLMGRSRNSHDEKAKKIKSSKPVHE